MENDPNLAPSELSAMAQSVVDGARRIESARIRRRNIVAGGVAVVLVVGVTGAAFAAPLLAPADVATAPSPTQTTLPQPIWTPTPTPTVVEPSQFTSAQRELDVLPDEVVGPFDRASTRLVGADDAVRFFIARGIEQQAPYCLILLPIAQPEGWAVGCGPLQGLRVTGTVVGEAQLSTPGTAPAGWTPIDDFVSVNPDAPRTPVSAPEVTQPAQPTPYTIADVQSALDGIGRDTPSDGDATAYEANRLRAVQTESLARDAAGRLGGPVALIRPTYVGLPDDASDSPNSLLWWVVTSEPTDFPFSHVHHVDGMDWTGWGQGDRDLGALQARLQSWLAENRPGQSWTVVTQSH